MITEQYVSFETAKMLKEAGFDSPTRGIYRTNRTGDHSFAEYTIKQTVDDLSWNAGDGFQYEYLAPTQSLAARWIREVHHYAVCIWFTKDHEKWFYAYGNMNRIVFDTDYNISEYKYDSYEAALEEGLQEVLKLIIKNKRNGQRNN